MDPIVVEVSESDLKEGVLPNPSANMRPRFLTVKGVVQYAGVDFQLEGSPGFYPGVKLSGLEAGDRVGFHY